MAGAEVGVGALSLIRLWTAEKRARLAGLDWPTGAALDDAALEACLYGAAAELPRRLLPDP
jgi:hypothetical protein